MSGQQAGFSDRNAMTRLRELPRQVARSQTLMQRKQTSLITLKPRVDGRISAPCKFIQPLIAAADGIFYAVEDCLCIDARKALTGLHGGVASGTNQPLAECGHMVFNAMLGGSDQFGGSGWSRRA